jgi:hypothetical protein
MNTMLCLTRRAAVIGAACSLGCMGEVDAQVGNPSAGAGAASWDGRWAGAFGARSDLVVTITGGKVTAATLLGQPLMMTASAVGATEVTVSGPTFALTLTRQTVTAAQAVYTNNRNERATALMMRQ